MDNNYWRYKIGSGKLPVILTSIMFAAFGGLTAWLYSTNNGAFIFTGLFSAILLALVIATGYRLAFFKVLIGKDGFYYQTGPSNGKLYNYADEKAVRYLIRRIESSSEKETAERRNEKAEYLIDGKVFGKTRIVIGIGLLVLVAIIDAVIIKATGHMYLAVPGFMMALVILLSLINSNLYYKIRIGETGFDYRTNPFNGKHFEYTEITGCRKIKKVVRHRYHVGDADLPSYFFCFEFTDAGGVKRKFQFEDQIHGHGVNVLKERIEKARIQ